MRNSGPPSEIRALTAPVFRLLDAIWLRMHWWIALMAFLYLVSGITIVKSDEVAIVLRWGRLLGDTPALQAHGPGLLFALPSPVDQVLRMRVKHVFEVPVDSLNSQGFGGEKTLDPLTQGYALTGDHNIVHVRMIARFRVRDPAEWAFYGPEAEEILRVEVAASMVRSLGEMGVDRVLSDGRKDLIATATRRAQEGLDAVHSGMELSSMEFTRLSPPQSLAPAFDEVQSAFITAQTRQNEAQAYAESAIPKARAEADSEIQTATGAAEAEQSKARGDSDAFLSLHREYAVNPVVVRERLYRDAIDRAIASSDEVRWVPPPVGGSYHGFRVTVRPSPAGEPPDLNDDSGFTDSVPESSPAARPAEPADEEGGE